MQLYMNYFHASSHFVCIKYFACSVILCVSFCFRCTVHIQWMYTFPSLCLLASTRLCTYCMFKQYILLHTFFKLKFITLHYLRIIKIGKRDNFTWYLKNMSHFFRQTPLLITFYKEISLLKFTKSISGDAQCKSFNLYIHYL